MPDTTTTATTTTTAAAALDRPDDPTPASAPNPGDPRPAGARTSGPTETAAEAGTDTARTRRRRRPATTATTPATIAATSTEPGTSAVGGPAASAHDRVWAALRRHPATTAADLADTSGVARSTVAKLLAAWSEDGSAISAAGATARAARLWTAAPSELPPAPDRPVSNPDSNPDGEPGSTVSAGAVPAEQTHAADHGPAARAAAPLRTGGRPPATTTRGSTNRSGTNRLDRNRSGTGRLAAGALQGMVQDYLSDHPGEHGPTAIGHALGRSSGAIANALERLVAAGWAELTQDRPRRYRSAEHPDTTEPGTANTPPSGTATDTAND